MKPLRSFPHAEYTRSDTSRFGGENDHCYSKSLTEIKTKYDHNYAFSRVLPIVPTVVPNSAEPRFGSLDQRNTSNNDNIHLYSMLILDMQKYVCVCMCVVCCPILTNIG